MFARTRKASIIARVMRFIFMGTGTSQGVPLIASKNEGLDLSNPKNWRTRASAHLNIKGLDIQIDAGPEFRLQCLKNNIKNIDFFILTHGHADHILGMDDLRRFCDLKPDHIVDVYGEDGGLERVKNIFPYALGDSPAQRGYPCFKLHNLPQLTDFGNGVKIRSTLLPHDTVKTLGLVFEEDSKKIAYYSDCKSLPDEAQRLAYKADALVIDGLRPGYHHSHMSIYEAIEYGKLLKAKSVYLTHTTGQIDYETWQRQLPENFFIAYDSLTFEV